MSFEPLLTTDDVSKELGLHPKTIEKLAREGKIRASRIGKRWKFRLSWVDEFVLARQNQSSQPSCV